MGRAMDLEEEMTYLTAEAYPHGKLALAISQATVQSLEGPRSHQSLRSSDHPTGLCLPLHTRPPSLPSHASFIPLAPSPQHGCM